MRKLLLWSSVLASALGGASCSNEQGFPSPPHRERDFSYNSSDEIAFDSIMRKNQWDYSNAPERMGLKSKDYEVHFDTLPKSGSLSKIPWSGGYWPTYAGGITYRWNHDSWEDEDRIYYDILDMDKLDGIDIAQLSPAEKIDIFLGNRDWDLTRYERERTDIMATLDGKEIPYWEGLCHAWAPATLMYDNPRPVTLTGPSGIEVPFGSSDVKALLTYLLHYTNSETYFASLRCNVDDTKLREQLDSGEISFEDYESIMESAECQGIHPGAFHIILTNLVALRDEGFIADVTRDQQVWNQPVHSFKTTVLEERSDNISEQAAPGTVKEILVKTTMTYTVEIDYHWERKVVPSSNRDIDYEYWLELDEYDNIIGGKWESEDRPDFLWKREPVTFEGFFAPLQEIYEASIDGSNDSRLRFVGLQWTIQKGLFRHSINLEGKAPEEVEKLQLKLYNSKGIVTGTYDVPLHVDRTFKHKINVWRWHADALSLVGFDASGKKVIKTYQKFE